jgi:hypothetical protein
MITAILILISIELGVLIYLNLKSPQEAKEKLLRKLGERTQSDIKEWIEPEDDVSIVSKKLTEEITKL